VVEQPFLLSGGLGASSTGEGIEIESFILDLILPLFRLLVFCLLWRMVPRRLLLDGLLFLPRLVLPLVTTILGVVWKGTTPVPVVSAQVMVIVREEWNVVIVTVMLVIVPVGCIVGLLVP
jgi:hypothetical protein